VNAAPARRMYTSNCGSLQVPEGPPHPGRRRPAPVVPILLGRWEARRPVEDFSRKSRWNLLKTLAHVRTDKLVSAVMLTLTFQVTCDWREAKRRLDVFLRLFERRGLVVGSIWCQELQERRFERYGEKVVHFHVAVWRTDERYTVEEFQKLCKQRWCKVCGTSVDSSHYQRGAVVTTGREFLKSLDTKEHGDVHELLQAELIHEAMSLYMSKYMSKGNEKRQRLGRRWGIRGKLPMYPVDQFYFDESQRAVEVLFLRLLRHHMERVHKAPRRFGQGGRARQRRPAHRSVKRLRYALPCELLQPIRVQRKILECAEHLAVAQWRFLGRSPKQLEAAASARAAGRRGLECVGPVEVKPLRTDRREPELRLRLKEEDLPWSSRAHAAQLASGLRRREENFWWFAFDPTASPRSKITSARRVLRRRHRRKLRGQYREHLKRECLSEAASARAYRPPTETLAEG